MTRDEFYSPAEAARRLLDRDDAAIRCVDVDGMCCFANPFKDARTVADFMRANQSIWFQLLDDEIGLSEADALELSTIAAQKGGYPDDLERHGPTWAETWVPVFGVLLISAVVIAVVLCMIPHPKGS